MPKESTETQFQSLEGIKFHPLYNLLTVKQQVFLNTYLSSGGDRVKAAKAAYHSWNPEQTGYRVLGNGRIKSLIQAFYGKQVDTSPMTKNELKGLIAARLRNPSMSESTFSKLTDLLMDLQFRRKKGAGRPPAAEQKEYEALSTDNIDALVMQLELDKKRAISNEPTD